MLASAPHPWHRHAPEDDDSADDNSVLLGGGDGFGTPLLQLLPPPLNYDPHTRALTPHRWWTRWQLCGALAAVLLCCGFVYLSYSHAGCEASLVPLPARGSAAAARVRAFVLPQYWK